MVSLLEGGSSPNGAEQSSWTPLHLAGQKKAFLGIIHLWSMVLMSTLATRWAGQLST